ncbi:hypothetical protein F511_08676 [Dorcoceras hygrometricum]|uniref:Uncharacterized protein n=1 Tax=Dorcoceras hygrometricum TaxID=472368 RepID=A0A2Z7CHU6_9LAMI|nr:hypothetical protein F511_08676 [Dorcoceras hygrometricum]
MRAATAPHAKRNVCARGRHLHDQFAQVERRCRAPPCATFAHGRRPVGTASRATMRDMRARAPPRGCGGVARHRGDMHARAPASGRGVARHRARHARTGAAKWVRRCGTRHARTGADQRARRSSHAARTIARIPLRIAHGRSRTSILPPPMLNKLSLISMRESRNQYLCDPQWFRDTASRGPTTCVTPKPHFRTSPSDHDLGLIHSTNGNHLESSNEGSSIDHQVTIHLHAQNITMFPTNETWSYNSSWFLNINRAPETDLLAGLDITLPHELSVDVLLLSLPAAFDPFVVNFNMNKLAATLEEVVNMLVVFEGTIKKDKPVLLMGSSSSAKKGPRRKGKKRSTLAKEEKTTC